MCGYGRRDVHWSNPFRDGSYRLFVRRRGKTPGKRAPEWSKRVPIHVRALTLTRDHLLAAGPARGSDSLSEGPGRLLVYALGGKRVGDFEVEGAPVFDGMAVADGNAYLSLADGHLVCFRQAGRK